MDNTTNFMNVFEYVKQFSITLVILFPIIYLCKKIITNGGKKLPPGPTGLPILGYLPFIGPEPHKTVFKMRQKYGNIVGLQFGMNYVVILNEYNVMKEALSHPNALDREPYIFGSIPTGFVSTNGPEWLEQRRFCMQALRDLGFGRKRWEAITEDSVHNFSEYILSHKGKPVDISEKLHITVSNNIISLLIGRKLNIIAEKDQLKAFTQFSGVFLNYVRTFRTDSVIPGFRTFCESLGIASFGRASKIISSVVHLVKEEIKKHRSLQECKEMEDFINIYDQKMKTVQTQDKSNFFSDENLLGGVLVVFLGSSDTIFSSTGWIIRLMAKHQDIQRKVQQELDEVVGRDNTISYDDRLKVPYTIAVMMESQRFSSIVPLSTTRMANADFEIQGYTIPKGAMLMGNLWGLHHDPDYWEKPDVFFPERFFEKGERKVIKNPPSFAPFSVGRRNCPGETVAWMVIFSFFTKIMQKFTVSTPPGTDAKFEIEGGLVQYLKPQPLIFTERT